MANNFTKTMRQALQEARDYRDTTEGGPGSGPQKGGKKFSSSEIKKAYGILNDPRYKQGNYTGAAKAINKLAPGLADHPDVKNAMKRANENLDLPATGDTTTSNASQEVEQVEDLKEYSSFWNLSIGRSLSSNQVATALKNLKKGTTLHVMGKPQNGMRTMGDVISISGDTVKIKPTASNGPTSVKVKDITFMDVFKEELEEARFSKAQIDQLKKQFEPLRGKGEKNAVQMDKLAKMMGKYKPDHLLQLSTLDIPMVSKVAKALLAKKDSRFSEETELDEAVTGLPKGRALMYIIKTDKNTARRIKSFLADHGELYPIHIDDDDSGQITLDAYDDRDAAHDAAQAISKKFNVNVRGTR